MDRSCTFEQDRNRIVPGIEHSTIYFQLISGAQRVDELVADYHPRIWWMSRRNRRLRQAWEKGPASVLYLMGLVIFIIGNLAAGDRFDAGSVLIQIGGITPTLLIVRVNAKGRPSEAEEDDFQQQITSRSVQSLSEILGVDFSEPPVVIGSHSSNTKINQSLQFTPERSL
ncbi:hypothetical protein L218DRAFT_1022778 [Marasmius fiardii PR-910]|nr:hypothetical protein L218DRAFT_1022778 [Marasmius fiardii PR-910]